MDQLLISKFQEAAADMAKLVTVNDNHQYSRVSDGKWLAGVSTVSNVMPKEWLSAWGGKEAVKDLGYTDYLDVEEEMERASKIHEEIKAMDTKQYIKRLGKAKGASGRKSKQALTDGTAGHAWLEDFVKARIQGTDLPIITEGMLERPLKQFVKWEAKYVDYWVLSEALVTDAETYAGRFDGLAMMKNGKLAIIDFKFASHISFDYYLQTAGYQHPFTKYGLKIDDRIIIRLPKTLEREEYDKVTHKYSKVPNDIEVKRVDTNYEFDRDTFLAALPVKKWINYMEHTYKKTTN